MGWIKRNLFFAIGGAVAIGLLGAAGFYDFASWGHNQAAFAHLNEVYTKLSDAAKLKPSPGNEKVDNIAAAKEQDRQLREWISQTTNYFQPIAPIPKPASGQISDSLFAGALHRTIAQLQHEAAVANVALQPDYAFSFSAHVAGTSTTGDRLTFAPGSLEPLSVQLGEVKTISEVLFGAGVNALDGIQRCRVLPDDANGPQTDYLDDPPVTTDLAVLVPYQVTFRGFSPEIVRVLNGFASSPHGFIVKTINVQTAGVAATDMGGYPPDAGLAAYRAAAGLPAPATSLPGRGGLQVVLNEQLLRVTMTVEVVKLAPRN